MQFTLTPEYLSKQGLSATFPDRFWAKVNKDGPIPEHVPKLGNCWVWTAHKHKYGYGEINKGRHSSAPIRSHVASWILHFGPIPKGLRVCHKCDNGQCVRPDHLFLGSQADNIKDGISKGRYLRDVTTGKMLRLSRNPPKRVQDTFEFAHEH